MTIDFGRLAIHNVIIHEIPRHRKGDADVVPILSEIVSPLTDNLRTFLREKVIESVGSSLAYRVCFLESPTSPIPQYIVDYVSNGQADFINISQEMAKHLHQIQPGISPQGLLTVVGCSLDKRTTLGILKIEKEEGIRLRHHDVGGKMTFDLEHVRELMLTKKTKLFKIGLFTLENDGSDVVCGFVCDYQRGRDPKKEVADFFLGKFLGCKLYNNPPVETKVFLHETQNFINTQVDNPVEKATYENHLLSELTNQKQTVNPRKFAQDYLKVEHRDAYIEHLNSKNITENQFDKDISLVKRHLEKMLIQFTNGVKVIAPKESIALSGAYADSLHASGHNDDQDHSVQIFQLDDGQDRVEITGKIVNITSV